MHTKSGSGTTPTRELRRHVGNLQVGNWTKFSFKENIKFLINGLKIFYTISRAKTIKVNLDSQNKGRPPQYNPDL